ncbi:MAG TPA: GNAT family N-acetyltransferase [Thermoanaerobaculia bacterium]
MEDARERPRPAEAGYAIQPFARLGVSEVLQHYEELTFPPVARRLAVRPAEGEWRGALAVGPGGPVGLALLELGGRGGGGTAQLFSLAVAPSHRRRGVGTALVAAAEGLAGDAGAREIEGAYRTSWRSREAIEALLRSRGWSPPETRLVLARGESGFARRFLRAPAPRLPPEAEIFSWDELTEAEREAILERQRDDPWYPDVLTPFQEEPRLEPTVSVGLRWRGAVAGWMICHRVAFDTLQYSALFLRDDLRGSGLGRALLRDAVRRRLADPDIRHTILAVDARNTPVRAWLEQAAPRYLAGISELRVSRKGLAG